LLAKVIAWGEDRDQAIARMERALRHFEVDGISTTVPFHRAVLAHSRLPGPPDQHEVGGGCVSFRTFSTDRLFDKVSS